MSQAWSIAPLRAPQFSKENYPQLPGDWNETGRIYSYTAGPKIADVALQWFRMAGPSGIKVASLPKADKEYKAIMTLVALDKINSIAGGQNLYVYAKVDNDKVTSIAIEAKNGELPVSPYSRYLDDYQRYLYAMEGPIPAMGATSLRNVLRERHDAVQSKREEKTKAKKLAHPPTPPTATSKRQLKKAAAKAKREEEKVAAQKKADEAKKEKDLREALIKAEKKKVDPLACRLKAHAELASLEEKAAKSAAIRASALRKADPSVEVSVDLQGWKLVTKPRRQRTAVFHTTGNAATRTNGMVDLKVEKTIKFGTV